VKPEVISRLEEIENVHIGNSTHVTAAERITWNSKETTAGAQSKANVVQANVDILEETVVSHLADYVRQPGYINPTAGTSTAYTGGTTPALAAYAEGVGVTIVPHVDCGASPTFNWDGKGATALLKQDGTAFGAGEMLEGKPYTFKKVGSSFLADSSAGLGEFFGDGSDGALDTTGLTLPVPTISAPCGGTVANLTDGNTSTQFITNNLRSATAPAVVAQLDFGQTINVTQFVFQQTLADQANASNLLTIEFSRDNINWNLFSTFTVPTTSSATYTVNGEGYGRYWRISNKLKNTTFEVTIGELVMAKKPVLELPSTLHGAAVVKQYSSINVAANTVVTVSNPCQGLVLYSQGNANISGTIIMSKKAGFGMSELPPIPMTKLILDKYNRLGVSMPNLKGGLGGSGGYGGGKNSGYRSSGGSGGNGRLLNGGYGGGGGAGGIDNVTGGNGGSITYTEIGVGQPATPATNVGVNGLYGSGGTTVTGTGAANLGGGGGGAGGRGDTTSPKPTSGDYAGGFVCIVSGGNITINAGGKMESNGGNGGTGGKGTWSSSPAFGGGGGGGGGAGGGVVSLFLKGTYVNNGSITVSGGTGGAGGSGSAGGDGTISEDGGSGTAGSIGTIYTQQL